MKTVSMSGSPRESVGKKDAKRLRKDGLVPCVIYGGKEQIHFSIEEKQFKPLVFTPEAAFVEVKIGDKTFNCILQDIQYHPVSDHILHADFFEFTPDMEVTMHIPLKTKGVAPGILKGGRLVVKYRKVPIRALPDAIPNEITFDISELEINDNFKVSDIQSDDYKVLLPETNFLLGVAVTRVAVEEEEEEGEGEEGEEGEGEEGEGGNEKKEGGEEKKEE